MATIIQYSQKDPECIKRHVEASLDYVRLVEHKLTEILEKLEVKDEM